MVIGYSLKEIKENELYQEGGYKNIYEFAEYEFHITKPTAIRLMNVCKYFSEGNNSPYLQEKYKGFSSSQLFELLTVSPENRKMAKPEMTVREIRLLKTGDSMNKKEILSEKERGVQSSVGTASYQTEMTDGFLTEESQKELPRFNDKEECAEWLRNVEAWGLWYEDNNIHARYYKYVFDDGSRLIAVKYRYTCPPSMKDEPEKYKEQIEADGGYYGEASYHMIYSDRYWAGHQEEYRNDYRKYFSEETAPMDSLVDFLMTIQREEKTDDYTWTEIEFDADHLEEDEIMGLPAKARQYALFFKKNHYIPKFFNLKNKSRIKDYAPTLTTSSGSFGGIGAVAVFDLSENIVDIVDDDTISYEEKGLEIKMLMNIACPEEKQKMDEFYGMKPGWKEFMNGFGGGKIRFKIRRYTPEQAFELMGMTKEDVERCRAMGVSDSQLFKQAGNAIVSNVVQELMKCLKKAAWQ